ncbi:MAG: uridine monophosphate kinase [Defluviitaleaceae bacterium]|nr:uridine monophosphate kinase [Defluviitaleaceae bacterium]
MFKRVIIKLSGEALAGNDQHKKFDDGVILGIIGQLKKLVDDGVEVALVVGGGNFWRGRDSKDGMDKVKSDQIGMMATIMNALYLSDMLNGEGIDAVVMTPVIVGTVTQQFSKKAALQFMSEKSVVIFAAGTGHPFFSTDTIAAIRAAELEVCALLFAKTIDGVYDSDPKQNHAAVKQDHITYRHIIANNISVIDTAASSILEAQKILSIVFALNEPEAILKCITGDADTIFEIGTKVTV